MQATVDSVDFGRVLVVEDDAAIRRRLCAVLAQTRDGAGTIHAVADLAGARAALQAGDFGLALVDVGLPDGNGVELIAWLHEHRPRTQALVVSGFGDEHTVLAALKAGAVGYLLKERDDIELVAALHSIRRGGSPIDPAVARHILAQLDAPAPPSRKSEIGLSERERTILKLVAKGFSNREIAEVTSLSHYTVGDYTKSIYRKLAVKSRTAAVYEARTQGLLDDES